MQDSENIVALDRARAEAAKRAQALWAAAEPSRDDHPYLARKAVKATVTLRELPAAKVRDLLKYAPRTGRAVLDGRILIVPVIIGGHIATVQMIDERGNKAFLAGGATKGGTWPSSNELPEGDGDGLTILIGEGVATVLSALEATGHLGVAAMSAGNLWAAGSTLTMRRPSAKLVFLADLDAHGRGLKAAEEAAHLLGGLVAIPDFGETRPEDCKDFNDLARTLGPEVVRASIMVARPVPDRGPDPESANEFDDRAEIERILKFGPVARDREIKAAAKRLGCRASTLDAAVKAALGQGGTLGQGRPLELPDPAPWPEPVDGAALLDEMATEIRRFVVMDAGLAEIASLWAVGCHVFDASPIFPRLVLSSPEKQCGKSTVLDILSFLTPKPLKAADTSPAALFRTIEIARPTLLLDEFDAYGVDSEEMRGVINAGHRRDGAVLRTVGEEHEPRMFSVWAPMAIAAIGRLPGTIEDRSIIITLRRRRRDERLERFRADRAESLERLARMAARWAADHRAALAKADPMVPDRIFNRPADNWRPMLAIADAAGGRWPELARRLAESMAAASAADETSTRVALLADIRAFFESEVVDRIYSEDLIKYLVTLEDRPWPEFKAGRPITQAGVARLLKPYKIKPTTVRVPGCKPSKGYKREQLADAFASYLTPEPDVSSVTSLQGAETLASAGGDDPLHQNPCNASESVGDANDSASCNAVTDENGGTGDSAYGDDLDDIPF